MRWTATCLLAALAACQESAPALETDWLASSSWDDGAAVVSVFRGRYRRYGTWREAEVRDYLIREYLHPEELTKRDRVDDTLVAVLKVNRQLAFNTGTYDYRKMHSLFFARATGELVKAVGSSQDGCGLTFQRWDRNDRALSFDSYWEGEGRGRRPLAKEGGTFFIDELAYVARLLPDGARVTLLPSLVRNKVGALETTEAVVAGGARERTVKTPGGETIATYAYDADGFLASWRIEGEQEFERVVKRRLYYWQKTSPGDRELLQPR